MRRLLVAPLLLLLMCNRGAPPSTDTIRAAVPPRTPPSTALTTVGEEPIVTTSGSPQPTVNVQRQFEEVIVRDGAIDARQLIPRGATAFRVTNAGTVTHAIAIAELAREPVAVTAPGKSMIVEARVTTSSLHLRCTVAGHTESAVIRTYQPH